MLCSAEAESERYSSKKVEQYLEISRGIFFLKFVEFSNFEQLIQPLTVIVRTVELRGLLYKIGNEQYL